MTNTVLARSNSSTSSLSTLSNDCSTNSNNNNNNNDDDTLIISSGKRHHQQSSQIKNGLVNQNNGITNESADDDEDDEEEEEEEDENNDGDGESDIDGNNRGDEDEEDEYEETNRGNDLIIDNVVADENHRDLVKADATNNNDDDNDDDEFITDENNNNGAIDYQKSATNDFDNGIINGNNNSKNLIKYGQSKWHVYCEQEMNSDDDEPEIDCNNNNINDNFNDNSVVDSNVVERLTNKSARKSQLAKLIASSDAILELKNTLLKNVIKSNNEPTKLTATNGGTQASNAPATNKTNVHSRNACKKLKCPKCNWHYKYKETLDIHMREKHSTDLTSTLSQQCIYCLEQTPHPRLGRGEQYKCGYKPYRCDICDYSTTTKGNLSIHMQSDKHINNLKELQSNGKPTTATSNGGSAVSCDSEIKIEIEQQQQESTTSSSSTNSRAANRSTNDQQQDGKEKPGTAFLFLDFSYSLHFVFLFFI